MPEDERRPQLQVVDRRTFDERLEALRTREKAHTREGDAIAAARRRLPMVEVAADSALVGPHGPVTLLDAFEGRRQLIAYYFMWWPGRPAAEQCEGCTWVMSQVSELAYLHSRDITYAVLCQGRNTAYGPGDATASYEESVRYRDFMGWDVPWYSAQPSLDTLLVGREQGLFHLVCYLREGDRVFETYWTKRRGAEVVDYSYALMDLTVFGRQEDWEDSPEGWPQRGHAFRTSSGAPEWSPLWEWPGGRPTAQWPPLAAGHSDDLGGVAADTAPTTATDAPDLESAVTTNDPVATVDARFSVAGAPAVPWSEARQVLEDADTFWLATVRSDCRPHVTPLIAMWHDDALYFSTGPAEQKAKNLGRNPQCTMTTGCNRLDTGLDVVVEGEAVRVTDEASLRALAEAWQAKYGSDWPLAGSQDAPDLVFRVAPMRAFGFRKGFGEGGQGCQTRWRWDRE